MSGRFLTARRLAAAGLASLVVLVAVSAALSQERGASKASRGQGLTLVLEGGQPIALKGHTFAIASPTDQRSSGLATAPVATDGIQILKPVDANSLPILQQLMEKRVYKDAVLELNTSQGSQKFTMKNVRVVSCSQAVTDPSAPESLETVTLSFGELQAQATPGNTTFTWQPNAARFR